MMAALTIAAAPLLLASPIRAQLATPAPVTIEIKDYVAMPITGSLDGTGQTDGMLARVNNLREEPGGAKRLFVGDLDRKSVV